MQKKTLIILSVFSIFLLVFSGIAYANNENHMANDIKNGVNNAGTTVVDGAKNLGDDIKNGVNDVSSDVVNGAEHLGDDVRNGVGKAENSIEGALRMNTTTDNRSNGNYVATRTTGDGETMGLNLNSQTTWVWIIMAIAAVIIVALIWYYAATTNNNNGRHDDDNEE